MKKNKLFLLSFAAFTLMFSGCSKNEDSSTVNEESKFTLGETVNKSFIGKIVDADNHPLSNVTVSINGSTVATNSNGEFTFSNVSVKERFAYFTAEKAGFMKGSRVVYPNEGLTSVFIMMVPEVVVATIPSGQSSIVSLQNGTKVSFDGSFKVENTGSAYNGNVRVMMSHINPDDRNVFYKMPGNLIAIDKTDNIVGLETYGMLTVELKGNNNEKLQLANGHTAKITMPIATTQISSAPEKMDLWHFNEVNGFWEQDGASARVGNNYVGNVSHFSSWNNDYAYPVSCLTVIAKNFDGSRVRGVRITLSRVAGSTGQVLIDLGTTNANGTLSAGIPRNENLIFRAYTEDGVLITTQTLSPTSSTSRTIEVVIPAPNKN